MLNAIRPMPATSSSGSRLPNPIRDSSDGRGCSKGRAGKGFHHSTTATSAETLSIFPVFTSSSSLRISRVAGAAASALEAPSSIVTATTYLGSSYGATATYQDWSPYGGRSAVPVLPAMSTG